MLVGMGLLAAGCGSVRSQAATLGSDVILSVREMEPEIFEIQNRLADSMGVFLGRAVETSVLARVTGVWDTMLLKANDQVRVLVGQMAVGVERDLNRSLQVTLDENLRLAGSAGRETVEGLVHTAFTTASANADPLVDKLMATLENGIRTRLRPVLIEVIGEAADSVSTRIAALDRMVAESETGKGVSRLLWLIVVGLAVTVIGGGIAWRRATVRDREALRVAMEAADAGKENVRGALRDRGFSRQADWLR